MAEHAPERPVPEGPLTPAEREELERAEGALHVSRVAEKLR